MNIYRSVLMISMLFMLTDLYAQDSSRVKELEQRLKILEEKIEQNELDKLLQAAENLPAQKEQKSESKTFQSRERAQQAMNPEISVASDFYGHYFLNDNHFTPDARSGTQLRVAELALQSDLDPFSTTKIIFEFTPREIVLAEAYMNWNQVFKNVSLTIGQFRQSFGVVNRWHEHALDQFDYPLVITTLFGEEGLSQTGLSLDWFVPPLWSAASTFTLQITNGQNENLFSGEMYSFPAVLGHMNSYYDLSRDTYLDLGFSGMAGNNNSRGYDQDGKLILETTRYTWLAGMDLSLLWEPVRMAKYKSWQWRTELIYVDKKISSSQHIQAWGGYSYVEYKMSLRWSTGIRFDYTRPLVLNNSDINFHQIVPYINWWQSEWVHLRLQYNFLDGRQMPEANQSLILQVNWVLGPHKHDRY